MSKKIAKVNVTSDFSRWWESDLSNLITNPDKVRIISAVVYEGTLYLIYEYDTELDSH